MEKLGKVHGRSTKPVLPSAKHLKLRVRLGWALRAMSLTLPAKLRNLELLDLGIYGVLVSVAVGIGLEAHGTIIFWVLGL